MGFVDELKRRKVGRVVLAYGAVAFAIAQGATTFFPVLKLPEWTVTITVVVCLLGLPVAAVLAWAFNVTDNGIVRDTGSRSRGRPIIAAITVVIFLTLGGVFAWRRLHTADPTLDPDLIAVLPFSVKADPSLDYLREGMVDLLASTLTSNSGARAADPRAVLSAWRRIAGDDKRDLPPDSAMRVARAVGAGRVLLGSIVGTQAKVTVTAEILTLPNGRRTRAQLEGAPAELSVLVNGLTAQLLSLSAGEQENRLETLTSTSLAALKEYLAGQSSFRRARFAEAAKRFDSALQIDSTFALAALGLRLTSGWGNSNAQNLPRSPSLLRRYRERLPPADREFAEALVGTTPETRSITDVLKAWSDYVGKYPDRADAWFQYGDETMHRSGFVGVADPDGEAKTLFDRSLALDSTYTPALVHLVDNAALVARDRKEFARLLGILERQGTEQETATYQLWIRAAFTGDSATIHAFRQALDTLPLFIHETITLFWFAGLGTPQDVERAIEVANRRALTPAERATTARDAHNAFMNMGRPAAALRQLENARRRDPSLDWDIRILRDAMFWDGDATVVRAAAERLQLAVARASAEQPTIEQRQATCALEEWRLRERDLQGVDAALKLLEAPMSDGAPYAPSVLCAAIVRALRESRPGSRETSALNRLDSLAAAGYGTAAMLRQANPVLVQLHEQRGELDKAARAAERWAVNVGDFVEFRSVWLREAGRLALATGDTATAIKHWTEYLRIRVRPEPSASAVDEGVRRSLEQLGPDRKR